MTHTPLTVSDEVSGFVYLEDDTGKKVLTVYGESAVKIERAHRLALCWNTHDGLLEALEELMEWEAMLMGFLPAVGIDLSKQKAAIKAARP